MCKHGQTSWKGRVRLKWTSGGNARFQTSETTELEVIANGIWHGKQSHARMLYNHVTQPWSLLFWAQYGEKDKISFFFAIGTDILNIFFFFWAHWPWQFLLNPRDGRIGSLLDSISPCEGVVGFHSWINLSYSSEEAKRVESNVRLIFLTCTKLDPSTKCCLFSCPLWLPRAQESQKLNSKPQVAPWIEKPGLNAFYRLLLSLV